MFEEYADEWKEVGTYPVGRGEGATTPKRNFPITPRENFELALNGKQPVYIPSMADMTALSPRLVPDNVVRAWVMEADPILPGADIQGGPDMFGVYWEYVKVTGGSMVRPGAPKVPDINRFEDYIDFPDLDEWDWEASAKANEYLYSPDRFTRVWLMNGLNERLISLMDFANVMVGLCRRRPESRRPPLL
ncbi:MAG: hypothetical protein FWH40_08330 [Coriobacteriia bacterium]|nr:hypothetical protein [Coriobacteriia bacterium]